MRNYLKILSLSLVMFANIPLAGAKPQILSGNIAQQNTNALTSKMNWYSSLGQAETDAGRQGKMILWIQMLGSIKGAT